MRFEGNSDQIDKVKKMSKARLAIIEALIAMLALGGGCSSFVLADDAAEQKALTSDGKAKKGNDSTLDLNDTDSRQSEMRGVIERYTADRGSLARFYGNASISWSRRSATRSTTRLLKCGARLVALTDRSINARTCSAGCRFAGFITSLLTRGR